MAKTTRTRTARAPRAKTGPRRARVITQSGNVMSRIVSSPQPVSLRAVRRFKILRCTGRFYREEARDAKLLACARRVPGLLALKKPHPDRVTSGRLRTGLVERGLRGGNAGAQGEGMAAARQAGFDGAKRSQDVTEVSRTHVTDTEVFALDSRMQSPRQRDAGRRDTGQEARRGHTRREARGGHRVSGELSLERNLTQAQYGDARAHRTRQRTVACEARIQALGQNLPQADVERPDEVHSRRAEIGHLAGFVGPHDGQPVAPVGIVVGDGTPAGPEGFHGARSGHHQRQAGGYACLLYTSPSPR